MKRAYKYLFLTFVLIGLFHSCADEQDFDQFDDLSIIPTVASSIFFFESDETTINLVSSISNSQFYNTIFTFEAFNEPFVSDNVLDGVITYEVENSTSKELSILVEFLDAGGNLLDAEAFTVQPAPPVMLLTRQIAYGNADRSLDILRNTANIRVTGANLGDGTSVSSEEEPKIILRSSAAFRLRLQ